MEGLHKFSVCSWENGHLGNGEEDGYNVELSVSILRTLAQCPQTLPGIWIQVGHDRACRCFQR